LFEFVSADGADLNSSVGVKYDSRIEGKFPYLDKVYVSVTIRDKSNITINMSDTKDKRLEELIKKDLWYQKKVNETLKDYSSSDDFVLHTYLPKGFGMFVTKEGFNKLLTDERINSVSLNDFGTAAGFATLRDVSFKKIFLLIIMILLVVFGRILLKKRGNKSGREK
jgi:hypothetical protein